MGTYFTYFLLKDNIPLDNSQKHHQPCLINLSVFGTTISRDPHLFLFACLQI